MKMTTIAILGSAAAIAVGIAAIVTRSGSAERETPAFFETLMPRVNDVSFVQVKRSDGEFSIRRAGEQWELVEKGGYPVRIDRVRETVLGLAELKAAQAMTSRPDRYAQIGVQDLSEASAAEAGGGGPTLLTFKDDAGAVIASAIVGNQRLGPRPAIYIRRPGEAQSWLAEGRLEIPGQFTNWIDSQILSIPRERIRRVDITAPDGEFFRLERETRDQRSFTVFGVPDGRELASNTAADAFGSALSFLSLEDVAPASTFDLAGSGVVRGSHLEFRTFDGLLIMAQLADRNGRTWARMAAMPDPEAEPTAAVIEEATSLNARLESWVFGLPAYKASVMKVTMRDMLQGGRPLELPASMMEDGIEIHDLSTGRPPAGIGTPAGLDAPSPGLP